MSTKTVYLVDKEDINSSNREDPINIISEIIGLPPGREWEITSKDEEKSLYMVHYSEALASTNQLDMEVYGNLRGVVVDTGYASISCKSSGHQIECVHDKLCTTPDNDYFSFTEKETGSVYTTPIDKSTINRGYEGIQLRIWKDSYGNAHISTFKKLNLDNSLSRGLSPLYFKQYYEMLNGPTAESFFDPSKRFSPYVHIMMIVHTDLLTVSRQIINTEHGGYIVYLGHKKMDVTYPDGEMETEPFNVVTADNIADATANKVLYAPSPLTIDEANHQLRYGYCVNTSADTIDDPRLFPGEFLVVKWNDMEFRVLSTGYDWRMQICPDGNRMRNFFIAAFNSRKSDTFGKEFPVVPLQDVSQLTSAITKGYPVLALNTGKILNRPTLNQRLTNVHLCFIMAIPIHLQEEALKYKDAYLQYMKQTTESINAIKQSNNTLYRLPTHLSTFINRIGRSASLVDIQTMLYRTDAQNCYKICKLLEKVKSKQSAV